MIEIATIISISPKNLVKFKKSDGRIQQGQIFFPYGFFGSIKINKNSLAMVFYDGGRDYPLICPINIISQPNFNQGEIQVGGFDNQTKIVVKENEIIITAPNNKIEGNLKVSGNIEVEGNVKINSNVEVQGTSNLQGQTTIQGKQFLIHTHSGVQSGLSNTGSVT
ncbi:MAG: hypothetical protein LW595_06570 [Rickettsiales bacterium]|nr:hypothetical protein [Rickettsiales bacterium]